MKKLFTLFALLMAIVVGARAVEVKTATLVTPNATCTSLTDADGIVTITGSGDDKVQTGNNMNGFTDKAMKLSANTDFTLSYKSGVTILKVNLYAVSNKDAETCTIGLGGSGKDNSSLGTVPNRKSNPLVIDFTNYTTFRLSAQSNVIIEVKYVTEALPTDRATIIEQPKGGKYVLNSTEDVTMSVDAYVTPGNTATYKWWLEDENGHTLDLSQVSPAGSTNTIKLSSFLDIPVTNESYIGQNYYFYCDITSSGNTVTTEKAKVQFLGLAVDAPTFSIASGSTIKVGQKFTVTAPEGTVIYSNWSSSQGKYTAESLMTRTPTEGNTTEVYTTTLGERYYSAIAVKEGYAPSAVAEVKLNVEALKFKGELDKTSDAVVKDAAAPALPVLTLKDDAGTEFSMPGFITATYALAEGSTPGIITINADGTGIESISTATAGTATVNITLASSQETATLIDGETGVYSYTVTVNESAPATEPSITTQPQDATYVIGTEDYPSMSVEATASAGELKYKWHIIIPSVGDIAIPGAEASTLSLATYASSPAFAPYLSQEGSYSIYCVVTDDNASVNTNTAKIIVKKAADPVGGVTITEEPSDVTYTIGDADYPSMSVQATAATGEITYDWQYSADGESFVSLASMVTSASTATLSGAEVIAALGNMIPNGQIPAGTYYVKCTLKNEGVETDTRIASLTVKAAEPVGPPATPTFSLPAGSTIKAGEPVVITSDDGSQIYYNWSGKATGGYDEAALLGRTPKDSPASCTTSTTGTRYLYALAKKGDATSEIAIIGYTVDPNPVKGQLDKTADVVDQYVDAPDLPVFTVVDVAGSPSTASIGDEKKDLSVKYELSSTATPGIVTLKADGSGIESISTATAGEATVIITLTSNKNGYPLIDGETGVYSYTITVNSADPITPTFSFANSTIGNNQTAQICVGDKKDMDGIKISEVEYLTQGVTVNKDNGVVTPTPGFVGTATFKISTSASADGKYSATTNNELTLTITDPIAVDPVFSLVKSTITAGETAQIQVGDKGNLDGIELCEVTFNTLNAIESLDKETGVIVLNEGFVGTVTFTFNSKSVENKYNYTENNELTLTVNAPLNYTKSVNIEQLVLDNGVKYDIANEFAESYVEYANINALDSLNDADGKFQRNEPFLGLKLKTSGAYIKAAVKQGSTLKVKFGNIGDKVKVDINGTAQADIQKMTTKDDGYTSTIYEYTAADADAVVTFTTSSSATVVLKQIMIDEEIADVILPWAINKPATVENGTAEMPSSAYPEQQVTITATPADGYELDAITVTGASTNNAYDVDDYGTFIMPYEAVNVSVTFKQATAINGVAENEATDAANVKVIKNGKLYIGKYNVAGQRVK